MNSSSSDKNRASNALRKGSGVATLNRRSFVNRVLAAGAAAGWSFWRGIPQANSAPGGISASARAAQRRQNAYRIRQDTALFEFNQPLPAHPNNGDEALYPNKIACYSKGLPHNQLGEVDVNAYQALLNALSSGQPNDFEAIPMGAPDPALRRRFVNPQAGLAFELEGTDSHALALPPAPAFSSAEGAGEIVENYWMALTRDVPFAEYDTSPLTQLAAADLSRLSDFRGPKHAGQVTTGTLFRGLTPGDSTGPYLSQFLWLPVPYGATFIEQRMRTKVAGIDYLTQYSDWLSCQQGFVPSQPEPFDPVRRYIRNGCDLAQWVHIDVLYQAYFHALMALLAPPASDFALSGMGAPFDPGNPYLHSLTQDGFCTFGGPHIAALMTEVSTRALKAVWYQKWFVHRRLRPEVFAGRIHNHLTGAAHYPLESDDLLGSLALQAVYDRHGTYLLPVAFPEGSPLHPAYGAGHATVAGACVTILKAWFDESYVIPNPVQATADGLTLAPYSGPALTVGGELNKLASNIALGRNIAGVHWRSDATESLKLGEAIAISVLRDQRATFNENFGGFTFTRFDGTTIIV